MANLTVSVPDQHVARVVAAYQAHMDGRGQARQAGETDAQFMRRAIALHIRETVQQIEALQTPPPDTSGIAS